MHFLIALFLFPCASLATSCASRYYCKADNVRFISMNGITGTYLDATPIKRCEVKYVSECQRLCVTEKRCQSLNLKKIKMKHECQLLDVNIYSNASLRVKDDSFVHLFIPSKCAESPCKNGGVCIPLYTSDSFRCECRAIRRTMLTKGQNCDRILRGHSSAFLYWSFDDPEKREALTSSSMATKSLKFFKWTGIHEPGRKTPVVLCMDSDLSCSQASNNIPCLNNFDKCNTKVTYSIWTKLQKKQIGRVGYIFRNKDPSPGIAFKTLEDNMFQINISLVSTKIWSTNFGLKTSEKTRWNHFAFTLDNSKCLCVFINGVKDHCTESFTTVSRPVMAKSAFRLGSSWPDGTVFALFLDDFAVWRDALDEVDVKIIYEGSK